MTRKRRRVWASYSNFAGVIDAATLAFTSMEMQAKTLSAAKERMITEREAYANRSSLAKISAPIPFVQSLLRKRRLIGRSTSWIADVRSPKIRTVAYSLTISFSLKSYSIAINNQKQYNLNSDAHPVRC